MTSTLLTRDLIFNTYDNITTRERSNLVRSNDVTEVTPELVLNMKKSSKKRINGAEYSETIRRRCSVCKAKNLKTSLIKVPLFTL
eukprot:Pgem_evm1s19825